MAQGAAQGSAQAGQGEGEQGSWLTLSEAAERSGLHKEALRARAKRGQLQVRKNNRGELLILLPPELLSPAQGSALSVAQTQVEQLADLVRTLEGELADLKVELAEARAEARTAKAVAIADVEAAKRVAEAEIAAKDALIAELKALLAEARKPWWRWWR
jgi:hypothetical protein